MNDKNLKVSSIKIKLFLQQDYIVDRVEKFYFYQLIL